MKKSIILIFIFLLFFSCGVFIDSNKSVDVLIYSSMEDYRNTQLQKMLTQKFPTYKIEIQYMSTGKSAAKIKAEKTKTPVDIVIDLEYAYCNMLKDNFADLSFIDNSIYNDKYVVSNKFLPFIKSSIAVVVNKDKLKEKNLPTPTCYEDLLNPIYKNSIIMPNPKTSATAYSFVVSMLNLFGEEEGLKYFDELNKNIISYTTSGSGPINSLILGEACIAVGMVGQTVNIINNGNTSLEILNLNQGTGYLLTGNAIIEGKEQKQKVKEVFSFIQNEYTLYEKQHFLPENIYKEDLIFNVPNYPSLKALDMTGIESLELKERILNLWKY